MCGQEEGSVVKQVNIQKMFIFIFIAFMITSCQQKVVTPPTDFPTSTPPVATNKPTLTPSITPTQTNTPAPTQTPTITLTPTATSTSLPWARTVIDSANAAQVTLLTHWGYGSIRWKEKVGTDRVLLKSTTGVYLFRVSDKKIIAEYYGAVKFQESPDKEKAAILFPDGSILLIQLEDAKVIHTISPLGGIPAYLCDDCDELTIRTWISWAMENTTLAFSQDGRYLACGYADRSIGVWDIETGNLKARLYHDVAGNAENIVFVPDGLHIASTGYGLFENIPSRLIYWSLEDQKMLWYINTSASLDLSLVSPDLKIIGYYSSGIRLINPQDGILIAQINGVASQKPFSPDSKLFVSTKDGMIKIEQVQPKYVHLWTIYTDLKSAIAEFSEDGSKIIVNGGEKVYSVPDFKLISEGSQPPQEQEISESDNEIWLSLGFGDNPRGVIVLPENQLYLWGGQNPVWRWNPLTNQMDWIHFSDELLTAPVISSDGSKVAGCFMDRVEIKSFEKEEFTMSVPCRRDSVLAFLPGNNILAIGRVNKITTFDVRNGEKVQDFIFSGDPIKWLEISPDGKFITSGGRICGMYGCRGDFHLWQVNPPRGLSLIPEGSEYAVEDVVFTSDGNEMIAAKGYVWLWKVVSGAQDGKLPLFGYKLAISPTDKLVAISRVGSQISLVDLESRQIVGNINISARRIFDLAFTPDGANLLILGDNGVLEVWGVP